MSFKRDGNDANWLKLLRKRRTDEILSDSIPNDEAKLLSNGRLACLVCSQYPVFDTVAMLHVHRGGKKHQLADSIFKERQFELKQLLLKRQQKDIINEGFSTLSLPQVTRAKLSSSSCSYDARSRPTIAKRRRITLDESPKTEDDTSHYTKHRTNQLSRLRHVIQSKGENTNFDVKPYKKHFSSDIASTSITVTHSSKPSNLRSSISTYSCVTSRQTSISCNSTCNYVASQHANNSACLDVTSEQTSHASNATRHVASTETCSQSSAACYKTASLQSHRKATSRIMDNNLKWFEVARSTPSDLEKELQMRESGWIKDKNGQWFKDENCEFDSTDEDDER